jgi:hypothetical protein
MKTIAVLLSEDFRYETGVFNPCRNVGMSECRNVGMSECQNVGMWDCRNTVYLRWSLRGTKQSQYLFLIGFYLQGAISVNGIGDCRTVG